jgi:hypothetical protein
MDSRSATLANYGLKTAIPAAQYMAVPNVAVKL